MGKDEDSDFQVLRATADTKAPNVLVLVHRETGVQYLYVSQGYQAGLTVLLDRDGKPFLRG